jgi:hypothetical protein
MSNGNGNGNDVEFHAEHKLPVWRYRVSKEEVDTILCRLIDSFVARTTVARIRVTQQYFNTHSLSTSTLLYSTCTALSTSL